MPNVKAQNFMSMGTNPMQKWIEQVQNIDSGDQNNVNKESSHKSKVQIKCRNT